MLTPISNHMFTVNREVNDMWELQLQRGAVRGSLLSILQFITTQALLRPLLSNFNIFYLEYLDSGSRVYTFFDFQMYDPQHSSLIVQSMKIGHESIS